MSRNLETKGPIQSPGEVLDKRIGDLNKEILQSRSKLEEYINVINSKIGHVISNKLTKFAIIHERIVDQKEQEIKTLQQNTQRYKENVLNKHVKGLQKTLFQYKQDIERVMNILEVFKKEAEKFKMELDIKDKQLQACKKREKELIKKVWMLEENIKDIYSYQFLQKKSNAQQPTPSQKNDSPKLRERNTTSYHSKHRKNVRRTLHTEEVSRNNQQQLKILIDDHSYNSKPSIYDATNLHQKLRILNNNRYQSTFRSSASFKSNNNKFNIKQPTFGSEKKQKYAMYDDLRHSLRKVDRVEVEMPRFLQQKDKLIGKEQYHLISVNAPKIMKLIEKIVIEKHGELRQFDQYSIELLNRLFENENAVKILEIMLFNYSMAAIREIKENKEELAQQNYYSQPSFQPRQQQQLLERRRHKKYRVDIAIHKNFKNIFGQGRATPRNGKQ